MNNSLLKTVTTFGQFSESQTEENTFEASWSIKTYLFCPLSC